MKTKSIFVSKTFWVNAIMFLLSIIVIVDPTMLAIFGVNPDQQVKVMTIIGMITTVLNILLRFITNSAVSIKSENLIGGGGGDKKP